MTDQTFHADDVKEIVERMARLGFAVTHHEAETAWGQRSEDYAAGWLGLSESDDALAEEIFRYIPEREKLAHPLDAVAIVERLAAEGLELTLQEAHAAWDAFSDDMLSDWISIPVDDATLRNTVETYLPIIRPKTASEALHDACKDILSTHTDIDFDLLDYGAKALSGFYISNPENWHSLSPKERAEMAAASVENFPA